MDITLKEKFLAQWKKYFNNSEIPIAFYFGDDNGTAQKAIRPQGRSCIICELSKVRKGESLVFSPDEIACMGAKRYLGYTDKVMNNFEYFLSYGIEGELEGERYKRNPAIVLEMQKLQHTLPTKGKNIVFKRWDNLVESDTPEAVIFFAKGEVLSGLFTLSNFDNIDPYGVIAPFAAGCGSIIHYPYLENQKEYPKSILGMFDPSARPCVPVDSLSLAVPMRKFEKMIAFMDESFLITKTWETVRNKIG